MPAAPLECIAIKPNDFMSLDWDLSGDSSVIHYLTDALAAEGSSSLD